MLFKYCLVCIIGGFITMINKRLEELKELFPEVPIKKVSIIKMESYGMYDWSKQEILIADDIQAEKMIQVLYHEFRHAWQLVHYPDLFCWWLNRTHQQIYMQFYYQYLNCIECDARVFGRTLGKRNMQFLFDYMDIEQLDSCEREGSLEFMQSMLLYQINGIDITPEHWNCKK